MNKHFRTARTTSPQALHLSEDFASKTELDQRLASSAFAWGPVVGLNTVDLTDGTIVANAGCGRRAHPNSIYHKAGKGANWLDGKMIDMPLLKSARKVLARARAAGK